jgi:hypothetical protein
VEYLALVYGSEDTWEQLSEEQRSAAYEGYMAVSRDATAAGALVDASELDRRGQRRAFACATARRWLPTARTRT